MKTPTFPALRAKIEEAVKAVDADLTGAHKREAVIRHVSTWLDDRTHWPATPAGAIAEALDGPLIRLLVGALVQEVYDRVQAEARCDRGAIAAARRLRAPATDAVTRCAHVPDAEDASACGLCGEDFETCEGYDLTGKTKCPLFTSAEGYRWADEVVTCPLHTPPPAELRRMAEEQFEAEK